MYHVFFSFCSETSTLTIIRPITLEIRARALLISHVNSLLYFPDVNQIWHLSTRVTKAGHCHAWSRPVHLFSKGLLCADERTDGYSPL